MEAWIVKRAVVVGLLCLLALQGCTSSTANQSGPANQMNNGEMPTPHQFGGHGSHG